MDFDQFRKPGGAKRSRVAWESAIPMQCGRSPIQIRSILRELTRKLFSHRLPLQKNEAGAAVGAGILGIPRAEAEREQWLWQEFI